MNKMKHRKWLSIALGTTLVAVGISALAFSCRNEGGKDGTQKKTNPTTPKDVDPKTVVKTGGSKQTTPVTQPKKSTVTLDTNSKLTKKDNNKYELKLNVSNAENKLVKVELAATSTGAIVATNSSTITSEFGTVKGGKVTVQFSSLDEKMDYKVKAVSIYQTQSDKNPVKVELATSVSNQKIQFEKPAVSAGQPQVLGDDPNAGQNGGKEAGKTGGTGIATPKKKTKKRELRKEPFNPDNHLYPVPTDPKDRAFIYNYLKDRLNGKAGTTKYSWFDKWEFNPENPFSPGSWKSPQTEEEVVTLSWMSALYALEKSYRKQLGDEKYFEHAEKLYNYFWKDKTQKEKNPHKGNYWGLDNAQRLLQRANENLEEELKNKSPAANESDQTSSSSSSSSSSQSGSESTTSSGSGSASTNSQSDSSSTINKDSSTNTHKQNNPISTPRRSGHSHGSGFTADNDEDTTEKESTKPNVTAGLSFENGRDETDATKTADGNYEFKVKFEKGAAGYSAILTLAKEGSDSTNTPITTIDEVEVTEGAVTTFKIKASDVKDISKLRIVKIAYTSDDFEDFAYVNIGSTKSLIVNIKK